MWIPKTYDELRNERIKKEKSARRTGLFFSIFSFFFLIIDYKYIGTKSKGGNELFGPTMSWNEIFDFSPYIFLISLLSGLCWYFYERNFRQVSSLLCDSCGKIKRFDKKKDCDCGGHFVFLDDMKWIDNNENQEENI